MNNSSYFNPQLLHKYPSEAGVYLMKNKEGTVLYIGKAKNLRTRLKQYFFSRTDDREMIPHLISEIHSIEFILVFSEKEALLLENTLIKQHKPKFNVLLKDDKTFISLNINPKEMWPRLQIIRYKGKPKKMGLYFGPYTSAYAARQIYELIHKIFPLRQCSDEELKRRTRPCILYEIKRCIAPCVQKCTKKDYQVVVEKAMDFLKGNDKKSLDNLRDEIQQASTALDFEKAAVLFDTLQQIERTLKGKSIVARNNGKDIDAIALYRHSKEVILVQLFFRDGKLVGSKSYNFSEVIGSDEELYISFLFQYYQNLSLKPEEILLPLELSERKMIEELLLIKLSQPKKGDKKTIILMTQKNAKAIFDQQTDENLLTEKLLIDLQETLELNQFPEKIECFDVSGMQGSDLVGSVVCFRSGKYDGKESRVFHIQEIRQSDDYAALAQVMTRRLTKAKNNNQLPDLIIIDGGKGHLNRALEVLRTLDIATVDLISIAKDQGKHHKHLTQEKIFIPHKPTPILLPLESPLLFLLQRIRDEAHRKVISFHRKKRQKRLITSLIDQIPGIGPVKKKRLLTHFGSLQQILAASNASLLEVKGITNKDISHIQQWKEQNKLIL